MRILVPALVVALFAPLSACYVGNAPPVSRRADAASATQPEADAAVTDDAAAPEDAATEPPLCERDEDCGEDGRCTTELMRPYCVLVPRARDAGPADTGPAFDCRSLCDGVQCGLRSSPQCDLVDCGGCGGGYQCNGLNRCEWTGALWAVTIASARVDRCDTSWDQCANGGQPLCAPSLPDPFVRFAGAVTTPAGNRCEGTYNQLAGTFDEPGLTAGMAFVLEDDDSAISNIRSGDVVCRGTLTVTPHELAAGSKTVTCAGGSVTFTFARRR